MPQFRPAVRSGLTSAGDVPGGPYRSMRPGPDRFTATAEVGSLSQRRCVHVEVDAGGLVTTRIVKRGCD